MASGALQLPPYAVSARSAESARYNPERSAVALVGMHTTPASLLDRLRRSPGEAQWERFVDIYTPLLFNWAHRIGLPPHDAADLVQDVFAILVGQLPTFQYDAQRSFR